MKIKKQYLFFLAGILWCFAGGMIMKIGIEALVPSGQYVLLLPACLVFFLFYKFVFSKLVKRYHERIMNVDANEMNWWTFFDKKSYLTMVMMTGFGMVLRNLSFIPVSFFAFFYPGLGFALFSCGIRFLVVFERERRRRYA